MLIAQEKNLKNGNRKLAIMWYWVHTTFEEWAEERAFEKKILISKPKEKQVLTEKF